MEDQRVQVTAERPLCRRPHHLSQPRTPANLPRRTSRRKGEEENPTRFAFKQNAGSPVKTDRRPGTPIARRRQDRRCFPTTPRRPAPAINQPQRW